MQKPLVRATVNGSSSGGREERESVIRIGGGRERVLHEDAPRRNYGRNTMVCMGGRGAAG